MDAEIRHLTKSVAALVAERAAVRLAVARRLRARDRAYEADHPDALSNRRGRIPTGHINSSTFDTSRWN